MFNAYIIWGFVLGVLFWYLIFYYRFADRTIVIELRRTLKETQKDAHRLSQELEEHQQQNIILRSKVQELFATNDDFSKVVSDLSRYYYQIKKWAEKAQELSSFLRVPDPVMEEKIQHYIDDHALVHRNLLLDDSKKHFF